VIFWLVQHYFPGQYLLFVAVMGAIGFVFREILWELVGHAWLYVRRLLKLAPDEAAPPVADAAPAAPPRNSVVGGLRGIRDHDSTFDAGAFLRRVREVCAMVGRGWADRSLEDCRAVMTDNCWQYQKGLLDRGVIEGWRGFASTITFTDGQISLASTRPQADTITVRVRIACPPGTGKLVRGRRVGEWVEDWTFVRPIVLALPPGARAPVSVQRGEWRLDRMDHFAVHMEKAQPAA
jgi:Tim44-like domain